MQSAGRLRWNLVVIRGVMIKKHCLLLVTGSLLLMLLSGALVAMLYLRSKDYTLTETSFTGDALKVVETHALLRLPEKSRGLNMVYVGSRGDPSFAAKIEVPPDAEGDIRHQIEKRDDQDYHPIGAPSEKVSWWSPAKSRVVVERKYTVDSSYVHVLLCHDNGQVVLLVESMSF
ncbi:MAG: hypothetical protein C5B50_23285 [Verrucomicrobia bacterium]|nr:MAG: hypothetical protein C5B50_23285 [Verrucomicrobiota bacterium]